MFIILAAPKGSLKPLINIKKCSVGTHRKHFSTTPHIHLLHANINRKMVHQN